MIESSDSKKKIFYTIVLILTLIAMIISSSIAYFSIVSSQKDEETKLYTGKLEINYIDGVYIKNPELWPIKKPNYNTTKDVYRNTFTVASSGTLDQTISVDLIVTKNEFASGAIKYSIYNEKGKELSTGSVPKEGKVNLTNNLFLAHDGTVKYTLLVWLDNTNYNQNFEMGNTITGKISILSKQLKR